MDNSESNITCMYNPSVLVSDDLKKEKFRGRKRRMTGWWMIRVVMMTLVR